MPPAMVQPLQSCFCQPADPLDPAYDFGTRSSRTYYLHDDTILSANYHYESRSSTRSLDTPMTHLNAGPILTRSLWFHCDSAHHIGRMKVAHVAEDPRLSESHSVRLFLLKNFYARYTRVVEGDRVPNDAHICPAHCIAHPYSHIWGNEFKIISCLYPNPIRWYWSWRGGRRWCQRYRGGCGWYRLCTSTEIQRHQDKIADVNKPVTVQVSGGVRSPWAAATILKSATFTAPSPLASPGLASTTPDSTTNVAVPAWLS